MTRIQNVANTANEASPAMFIAGDPSLDLLNSIGTPATRGQVRTCYSMTPYGNPPNKLFIVHVRAMAVPVLV